MDAFFIKGSLLIIQLPPTDGNRAALYVYDLQGKLVHHYEISDNENYEWDGRADNGDFLRMGAYTFVLKFTATEKMIGTITIVN